MRSCMYLLLIIVYLLFVTVTFVVPEFILSFNNNSIGMLEENPELELCGLVCRWQSTRLIGLYYRLANRALTF